MVNIPGFTPGYPSVICVAGLIIYAPIHITIVSPMQTAIGMAYSCLAPRRRRPGQTPFGFPKPQPQSQQAPSPPRSLPYQRPNANISTISLSSPSQGTSLLTTLPAEVRLQIWQYVIGDNHFQLYQKGNHIIIDRTQYPTPWYPKAHPLNLLLACRQIYSEAIDLLYSTNRFTITDPRVLIYFHDYIILPKRWQQIRNLAVCYGGGGWKHPRVRAWELIETLPHLVELTVRLDVDVNTYHRCRLTDLEWLQPMLQVRGVRRFRLGVVRLEEGGKRGNLGWTDVLVGRLEEGGNGVELIEAGPWGPSSVGICTFPMH